MTSACFPKDSQSTKTTSSCFSPSLNQTLLTAKPNDVTLTPFGRDLISGFLVNLPDNTTTLKLILFYQSFLKKPPTHVDRVENGNTLPTIYPKNNAPAHK